PPNPPAVLARGGDPPNPPPVFARGGDPPKPPPVSAPGGAPPESPRCIGSGGRPPESPRGAAEDVVGVPVVRAAEDDHLAASGGGTGEPDRGGVRLSS